MHALSIPVEAGSNSAEGKTPRVGKCEGMRWRGRRAAKKAAPIECECMLTVSLWMSVCQREYLGRPRRGREYPASKEEVPPNLPSPRPGYSHPIAE